MTRRTRLRWRRTAVYATVTVMLAADATLATVIALQDRTAAVLFTAVVLAYFAIIALGIVGAYAARTAWLAATDRHRRSSWSRRPAMAAEDIAAHRARADADEQAHAAAMAALDTDYAVLARHAAREAALPPTLPMPVVTQTAPTWGFDGTHMVEVGGAR